MTGDKEMRVRVQRIANAFPEIVLQAMVIEYTIELAEMKRRTPVDTGALQSSGHLVPVIQGKLCIVHIVFGGPGVDYALVVHEDLDAFHRVGQAKYVESVLMESAAFMRTRLGRRIQVQMQLTA